MGCKTTTHKKPIEKIKEDSKGDVTDSPSFSKVSNQAPTAGTNGVKVVVKFKLNVLLEKEYKEDLLIQDLLNDIQHILPNHCENAIYDYTSRGTNLLNQTGELVKTLIKDTSSPVIVNLNAEKSKEIIIEIHLEGLEDFPNDVMSMYVSTNLLGKPFNGQNEFLVAIFDKLTGEIKIEKFDPDSEFHCQINSFSDLSAYCNGKDHLFISGGESDFFWEIDLTNKKITNANSKLNTIRKLHSMIYIPECYVLIVGGLREKKVECYNIKTREISHHSELNEERIEPALTLINNCYLYAFTGFESNRSRNLNSFERINLRSNSQTWEMIHPNLENGSFTQSFFAVGHYTPGSLLFLGGIQNSEKEEKENKFSFIYDYQNNLIIKSDKPHLNLEFAEKSFYPLQEESFALSPNFKDMECLSLVKYTSHNWPHVINFESDDDLFVINDNENNGIKPYNGLTLYHDNDVTYERKKKEPIEIENEDVIQNENTNRVDEDNNNNFIVHDNTEEVLPLVDITEAHENILIENQKEIKYDKIVYIIIVDEANKTPIQEQVQDNDSSSSFVDVADNEILTDKIVEDKDMIEHSIIPDNGNLPIEKEKDAFIIEENKINEEIQNLPPSIKQNDSFTIEENKINEEIQNLPPSIKQNDSFTIEENKINEEVDNLPIEKEKLNETEVIGFNEEIKSISSEKDDTLILEENKVNDLISNIHTEKHEFIIEHNDQENDFIENNLIPICETSVIDSKFKFTKEVDETIEDIRESDLVLENGSIDENRAIKLEEVVVKEENKPSNIVINYFTDLKHWQKSFKIIQENPTEEEVNNNKEKENDIEKELKQEIGKIEKKTYPNISSNFENKEKENEIKQENDKIEEKEHHISSHSIHIEELKSEKNIQIQAAGLEVNEVEL